MSGRRLHAPELPIGGGEVALDADSSRHAKVLRLAPGDEVVLFDGSGRIARATIARLEGKALICSAEPSHEARASVPRLVLVQCMPKGAKLDAIVRMATELGVAEIRLADSENAVAKLDASKVDARLDRLRRIVREAARQSERASFPPLHPPAPLEEVGALRPEGARALICAARGDRPLREVLADADTPDEVWVVVGPEGGLAEGERSALEASGFESISLGETILRVETAAPAAVAAILSRLGRPADDRASSGR